MHHLIETERQTRSRADVLEALVRQLHAGVVMRESGYYIPRTGTFVDENAARDLVVNRRRMKRLRSLIDNTNTP